MSILPTTTTTIPGSPPPLIVPRRLRKSHLYLLILSALTLLFFSPRAFTPSGQSYGLRIWDSARLGSGGQWSSVMQGWLPHGEAQESKECKGWDPEKPEEEDPVGCLKARQWRQTQRVIEREIKKEHTHWWFTVDHNVETLEHISKCFLPVTDPEWIACHEKPLILSGWWYTAEVLTGATTGEVIWMSSVVKQLAQLGYSYIAVGPWGNWQTVAEMMPDVYLLIWNSDIDTISCITDPRCVAKEHYVPPEGAEDLSVGVPDEERGVIPLWALNIVDYWGARPREVSHNRYWWDLQQDGEWSYQPLGSEWVATPWPLPHHSHLPYSIEETCLAIPLIPAEERREAALVFAKRSSYFHHSHVTPIAHWTNLSRNVDFDLLLTADVEEGKPLPDELESMGRQTMEGFEQLVASVKAIVGVGMPVMSPSVYNALCQATPVVLPYFFKEKEQSNWRHYSGYSQHGPAAKLGEPYVYHYDARNYTDLERAVTTAVSTPVERYVPEDMRFPFALEKLAEYLARPLEKLMAERVAENGGEVPRMLKGVRERCYELERCRSTLDAGRRPALPPSFSL
ncbi:hypothetical protein IAT38_000093 [Cryptococcus sp. DSM 104549]